ncbi:MAG: enoyl-CoA hydratase [Proteobacteria bacterium]|nr:enoyl-CoA hydratase [Pseudomonadota bacterium]
MKADEFKDILYEKEEETGIVTVTMNTPKRKNALSGISGLELWWAMDIFNKDASAHAMIMTGAKDPDNDDPTQEAFSSGGYFNPNAKDEIGEDVLDQLDPTDIACKRLVEKMWYLDKPVIAAINGLAIGMGFTMPLGCADLIYMSEHAWIRLPFVRLNILPEMASTFILPRLVGMQRAKEIMLLGEPVKAREACEMGLVNKVLPHDELLPYARETALKLIPPGGPGMAVRLTKRALHRQLNGDIQRALDEENIGLNQAFTSEDFAEAVLARIEKRNPVYKGR